MGRAKELLPRLHPPAGRAVGRGLEQRSGHHLPGQFGVGVVGLAEGDADVDELIDQPGRRHRPAGGVQGLPHGLVEQGLGQTRHGREVQEDGADRHPGLGGDVTGGGGGEALGPDHGAGGAQELGSGLLFTFGSGDHND